MQYFPLEPHRTWEYEVTRETMDGARVLRYVIRNLTPVHIGERSAVPRRTADGSTYYYAGGEQGVQRIATRLRTDAVLRRHTPAQVVLPAQPAPGMSWSASSRTAALAKTGPPQQTLYRIDVEVPLRYTVESVDDVVEVPAGRFSGCLRVAGRGSVSADVRNYIGRATIAIEVREWYAPGVGLVRAERDERTSSDALPAGRLLMELRRVERG